ncbi:MAG: response regulator, partial [Candidatus Omnitrophica bacterium]|nr:response regulator [Candidatus Omnitrophota bacterium]
MEKTILVVDDEPDIMETLGLRLQRAGYHMISASGGEEALRKVAALHPDLIVLDLMMPSPDGMKVCQIIKSNPDFRNIPVILLSARS